MGRLSEALASARKRGDVSTWPDEAREFYQERAGIRHFCGGMALEDAEAAAREDAIAYFAARKREEEQFWQDGDRKREGER